MFFHSFLYTSWVKGYHKLASFASKWLPTDYGVISIGKCDRSYIHSNEGGHRLKSFFRSLFHHRKFQNIRCKAIFARLAKSHYGCSSIIKGTLSPPTITVILPFSRMFPCLLHFVKRKDKRDYDKICFVL